MRFIPIPVRRELAGYVTGEIASDDNPLILSEDMVEVALPNGVLVYAGWYEGDNDPGKYRIYVDYELNRLIPYIETDDPYEAAYDVATLAAEYHRYPLQVSDSESTVPPPRTLAVAG
jgi:hypothetical protein